MLLRVVLLCVVFLCVMLLCLALRNKTRKGGKVPVRVILPGDKKRVEEAAPCGEHHASPPSPSPLITPDS